LETEKATVEVPASASGRVKEIRVKEGETIKVGQVILIVEEGAGAKAEKRAAAPAAKPKEESREKAEAQEEAVRAAAAPARAPSAEAPPGPRLEEAEVAAVTRRAEEPREQALPKREEEVEPVREESAPRPPGEVAEFRREVPPAPEAVAQRELAPATPAVRRLARELGIDINEVTGSGPGGRISDEDVKNHARSIILNLTRLRPAVQPLGAPLPDFARWGEIERISMSSIRRKTAEHVTQAWQSIPHVTQFDQTDITELEELRERFAKKAEAAGGKLTITAIALKVAAAALKVFPQFNASLDMASDEIIFKKYYHIGVAVDTDRGLLVPVIRDVDKKNVLVLAAELTEMAEKARNRKITIEEMQGGTFTITNLGGIGGTIFTPIVNSPEVAILGVSHASKQPIFVDGQFSPRLMLPLALSYDHRLIDGADAARFLRWIAEALRQPFLLTLEG
jgi:pyruvate dehydrogenase E2 component (dihydrolipoamide acetyltransferase)